LAAWACKGETQGGQHGERIACEAEAKRCYLKIDEGRPTCTPGVRPMLWMMPLRSPSWD
jgi:hypothetical protein